LVELERDLEEKMKELEEVNERIQNFSVPYSGTMKKTLNSNNFLIENLLKFLK